jgi:hypothetical protein
VATFASKLPDVPAVFAGIEDAIRDSSGAGFERTFLLAGKPVRFHVLDAPLADLLFAPFEHLPSSSSDPLLTVCATSRSLRPGASAEGVDRVQSSEDGRFILHSVARSGAQWCLDRATARVVGATGPAAGQSLHERSKPLQPLLEFWLGQGQFQIIHAGMAACDGQGVVFAGFNGAGKSTAAVGCLRGGLDYLGDDRIALENRPDGTSAGHSLYGTTWLYPDHLARFPDLAPHGIAGEWPAEPKHLLMVSRLFPGQFPPSAPIRFVLLPRVRAGSRTKLLPASRGEALRCLAPGCLLTAPRLGHQGFASLARLVQNTECRWIELGDDIDAIPRTVEAMIRG